MSAEAAELQLKAHLRKAVRCGKYDRPLGSAEHYAAAAAAAAAAGDAPASLRVLFPRLSSSLSSTVAASKPGISSTAAKALWESAYALHSECLPHVGALVSSGALAPGRGSPAEKALFATINACGTVAYGLAESLDSSAGGRRLREQSTQATGELVGYATALKAAGLALMRLYPTPYSTQRGVAPPSAEEKLSMQELVLRSLELVPSAFHFRMVRSLLTLSFSPLIEEYALLRVMSVPPSALRSDDPVFDARLGAAWASVSPLFTHPQLMAFGAEMTRRSEELQMRKGAAAVARHGGLRPCGGCAQVEVPGLLHMTCPCRIAAYCSNACQASHWQAHKAGCQSARAAAAAAAAAADAEEEEE